MRRDHVVVRSRDTGSCVCTVAPMADATLATASATSQARTSGVAHQVSPLGPAGPSRAPHRKEVCEHANLSM
jgi:hypothetical protein